MFLHTLLSLTFHTYCHVLWFLFFLTLNIFIHLLYLSSFFVGFSWDTHVSVCMHIHIYAYIPMLIYRHTSYVYNWMDLYLHSYKVYSICSHPTLYHVSLRIYLPTPSSLTAFLTSISIIFNTSFSSICNFAMCMGLTSSVRFLKHLFCKGWLQPVIHYFTNTYLGFHVYPSLTFSLNMLSIAFSLLFFLHTTGLLPNEWDGT